jgi:hypothetical protein
MVWRRVVEGALAGRCCQPCRSALSASPVGQPCWPALLASPAQPVSPQGRGAMEVCHSRMGYTGRRPISGFKAVASRLWLCRPVSRGSCRNAVALAVIRCGASGHLVELARRSRTCQGLVAAGLPVAGPMEAPC